VEGHAVNGRRGAGQLSFGFVRRGKRPWGPRSREVHRYRVSLITPYRGVSALLMVGNTQK
jgi:hypothetical protein